MDYQLINYILNLIQDMHDRLNFFNHAGHKIMWCDYSKSGEEQMIKLLEEAVVYGKTAGDHLNILADFKSTPKCPEFNKKLKAYGKSYHQSGIEVKAAILGIDSPLKRVVVNATMAITRIKNVRLFDSKEDALKWLVES
ncbi:hypothetical protein [Ekhidna sp.]